MAYTWPLQNSSEIAESFVSSGKVWTSKGKTAPYG